jgi:hypothetical protein
MHRLPLVAAARRACTTYCRAGLSALMLKKIADMHSCHAHQATHCSEWPDCGWTEASTWICHCAQHSWQKRPRVCAAQPRCRPCVKGTQGKPISEKHRHKNVQKGTKRTGQDNSRHLLTHSEDKRAPLPKKVPTSQRAPCQSTFKAHQCGKSRRTFQDPPDPCQGVAGTVQAHPVRWSSGTHRLGLGYCAPRRGFAGLGDCGTED